MQGGISTVMRSDKVLWIWYMIVVGEILRSPYPDSLDVWPSLINLGNSSVDSRLLFRIFEASSFHMFEAYMLLVFILWCTHMVTMLNARSDTVYVVALPKVLPWRPESVVSSDGASKATETQGIRPRKFLGLIDPLDQYLRVEFPQNFHLRSPWNLSSVPSSLVLLLPPSPWNPETFPQRYITTLFCTKDWRWSWR